MAGVGLSLPLPPHIDESDDSDSGSQVPGPGVPRFALHGPSSILEPFSRRRLRSPHLSLGHRFRSGTSVIPHSVYGRTGHYTLSDHYATWISDGDPAFNLDRPSSMSADEFQRLLDGTVDSRRRAQFPDMRNYPNYMAVRLRDLRWDFSYDGLLQYFHDRGVQISPYRIGIDAHTDPDFNPYAVPRPSSTTRIFSLAWISLLYLVYICRTYLDAEFLDRFGYTWRILNPTDHPREYRSYLAPAGSLAPPKHQHAFIAGILHHLVHPVFPPVLQSEDPFVCRENLAAVLIVHGLPADLVAGLSYAVLIGAVVTLGVLHDHFSTSWGDVIVDFCSVRPTTASLLRRELLGHF